MKPDKKISAYIAANCANYDRDGLCHLETTESGLRLCPLFFDIGKRCLYAERAVLPGDPVIESHYNARRGKNAAGMAECIECHEPYIKTSNRQQRCPDCANRRRRRKQLDYNATYRRGKSEHLGH